jgi:hypothetical protein
MASVKAVHARCEQKQLQGQRSMSETSVITIITIILMEVSINSGIILLEFSCCDFFMIQYAKDGRKGVSGSLYGPIVIRFAGQPI